MLVPTYLRVPVVAAPAPACCAGFDLVEFGCCTLPLTFCSKTVCCLLLLRQPSCTRCLCCMCMLCEHTTLACRRLLPVSAHTSTLVACGLCVSCAVLLMLLCAACTVGTDADTLQECLRLLGCGNCQKPHLPCHVPSPKSVHHAAHIVVCWQLQTLELHHFGPGCCSWRSRQVGQLAAGTHDAAAAGMTV